MSEITDLLGQMNASLSATVGGNPLVSGILILAFFGGFVFLQGQRLDGKVLIIGGAVLLSIGFLPAWLQVVFVLVAAVIVFLALRRPLR